MVRLPSVRPVAQRRMLLHRDQRAERRLDSVDAGLQCLISAAGICGNGYVQLIKSGFGDSSKRDRSRYPAYRRFPSASTATPVGPFN